LYPTLYILEVPQLSAKLCIAYYESHGWHLHCPAATYVMKQGAVRRVKADDFELTIASI